MRLHKSTSKGELREFCEIFYAYNYRTEHLVISWGGEGWYYTEAIFNVNGKREILAYPVSGRISDNLKKIEFLVQEIEELYGLK